MPPKKKENGGKGASAGPKVVDEPSQPAPGAPYCLSLVLEVCLDAAEPPSLVEPCGGGDAQPTEGAGRDNGSEDARSREKKAPLLVEPVFRYTFVNGDRISTPPVGYPGSSWTRLGPAAPNSAGDLSPPAAGSSPEAETTISSGQQELDKRPPEHVVWKYTRVHQLQGADDDEVFVCTGRTCDRTLRTL